MGRKIGKCVVDACALIAFLRGEEGGSTLQKLLKGSSHTLFMHAVNLGEVYYDSLRVSGEQEAKELIQNIIKLPIHFIWTLDVPFLETVGKYKTSFRISYADAFVLALAEREDASIISTDYHEFAAIEETGKLKFYWLRKKSSS